MVWSAYPVAYMLRRVSDRKRSCLIGDVLQYTPTIGARATFPHLRLVWIWALSVLHLFGRGLGLNRHILRLPIILLVCVGGLDLDLNRGKPPNPNP